MAKKFPIDLENVKKDTEERIVLNVGGVRYETRRSTLTKYPDTMLGTMFHERNKALLHPSKDNEYFIDRDGHLFRFVLQFYRIGKIPTPDQVIGLLPISPQELDAEFDYFMIPRPKPEKPPPKPPMPKFSIRHKMIGQEIDDFVEALKKIINQLSLKFYEEFLINRNFEVSVEMSFHKSDRLRLYIIAPPTDIKSRIQKIIEPFERIGYLLLELGLGPDIGRHLTNTMNGVKWDVKEREKSIDPNCIKRFFDTKISIVDTLDRSDIIKNTCLGETEILSTDTL